MTSIMLFFLLACGGGETPADAGDGANTEAPAPAPAPAAAPDGAAFTAPEIESGADICLGGIDCEAVQLSCCCGEGAVYVAVNKSRAEDIKKKYGQQGCGDCPAGECTPPEVTCSGGCKLK